MSKLTDLEAQIAKLQAEADKEREADPATQLRAAAQELREAKQSLDDAREQLKRFTPAIYPLPYYHPNYTLYPWWNNRQPGSIFIGGAATISDGTTPTTSNQLVVSADDPNVHYTQSNAWPGFVSGTMRLSAGS